MVKFSNILESLIIANESNNYQEINKDYLVGASYNKPSFPYQDGYFSNDDQKKYENLLSKLYQSVTKGASKIKSLSKKYSSLTLTEFISKSFIDFEKSNEWKTITSILKTIQDIEVEYGGIELYEVDVLNDWQLINTEAYNNATLYDFKLLSCSQDSFFIYDNIISYLLNQICKNIPKATANCFADDSAVFTVVIRK